jgi:BirA family biotin operon repressor/biotin-[acetyl-CoA-carboxylase] ligase
VNAIDPRAILNGIDLVLLEPNIVCVNQTESTNALARIMVERGLGEGLVVIADLQTQGRGRHSRTWHSPLGGLYFSIVLKPRIADENAPLLGFLTACAIATGLHEVLGLEVSLKWPNDILVGERKLGGILSETVSTNGSLLVVIGVGINQNAKREDLPAEIQSAEKRQKRILSQLLSAESIPDSVEWGPICRLAQSLMSGLGTAAPSADQCAFMMGQTSSKGLLSALDLMGP